MNHEQPTEFVSLAQIARLANRATDTVERGLQRAGIPADGTIAAGRGMMPVFKADRVSEILAALGPAARPHLGSTLSQAMFM